MDPSMRSLNPGVTVVEPRVAFAPVVLISRSAAALNFRPTSPPKLASRPMSMRATRPLLVIENPESVMVTPPKGSRRALPLTSSSMPSALSVKTT